MMTPDSVYKPGQSANFADSSLKTAIVEMDSAKHRAVLWFADIMKRCLFRHLGYSNMPQYATAELKFSKTRTGDFMRLARKLDELPAVRQSLAKGDLGYTKVVEIIKVATPATQDAWIKEAAQTGRRELARKVKRVKTKARRRQYLAGQGNLLGENHMEKQLAAAVPVRMALEMTPEQSAQFEALTERVKKTGSVSPGTGRVETILAALENMALGTSAGTTSCHETDSATSTRRRVFPPPFQVHVHQCPDCQRSTVQTSRGELEMDEADTERARCDARIKQPGLPNRSTVAPGRRNEVLRRDRFRCRAPGCGNTRYLEVHHVKPKARGGDNEMTNLVTLCSGCHRLHHEGRLKVLPEVSRQQGRSPAGPRRT